MGLPIRLEMFNNTLIFVLSLADFLIKKSIAVEQIEESEIIFNISRTDSDNYSLVFTSSAIYFFQDDFDETIENLEMSIYSERTKETRPESLLSTSSTTCKYHLALYLWTVMY